MATTKDNSTPAGGLASLTDRELLLFVHQDLSRQVKASETAVLTEIDGVRKAITQLAPLASKVDALIADTRGLSATVRRALGELKLAHARIVELEAVGARRAGRSR